MNIKCKGIIEKDDDEFIVKFEIYCDNFEQASTIRSKLITNLNNNLKGQKVLFDD